MKLQWILESVNYKISIKDSKNKVKCLNIAEYAENQYQSEKSIGLWDNNMNINYHCMHKCKFKLYYAKKKIYLQKNIKILFGCEVV